VEDKRDSAETAQQIAAAHVALDTNDLKRKMSVFAARTGRIHREARHRQGL
jgi:hypothetical protein